MDAWRLVMSLRSGMSAEVAWSLNILNILLYDDSCAALFQLKALPGLLEVLVEHFRRALVQLYPEEDFDSLEDYWLDQGSSKSGESSRDESPAVGDVAVTEGRRFVVVESNESDSKCGLENGRVPGVSRLGRPVRWKRVPPPVKRRRRLPGACPEVTREAWEEGGGLATDHLNLKYPREHDDMDTFALFAKRPSTSTADLKPKVEVKAEVEEKPSIPPFFFRDFEPDSKSWDLCSSEVGAPVSSALTDRSEWATRVSDLALAVSNVIRGLVVIPGNEAEMARHPGLLMLIGRCLGLKHKHLAPRAKFARSHSPQGDKAEPSRAIDVEDADAVCEAWRFETATQLREDAFVVLCQLSVQLDLCAHEESVVRPIVDSLLHWTTCQSAEAKDPLLPGYLSPRRYSLEALCKLSVLERNVDLILSTPPWARTAKLLEVLSGMLNMGEDVPVREFCLVIISALCAASEAVCILTAQDTGAIGHLVGFLEAADGLMHQVVSQSGMGALRENPEQMGTSVGMLRRAASVLACLARVPGCRGRFLRHQQRLLQFTMSQLMDSRVAAIVADSLWQLQQPPPPDAYLPPPETPPPTESVSVKSEVGEAEEGEAVAGVEERPAVNGAASPPAPRVNGECGKALPPLPSFPSSEKVPV